MLKKTITYTDFNDVVRAEDFYFNLTKAELLRMEMETPGGLAAYIEGITSARDTTAVAKWVERFIGWCYGEKSTDGRTFKKSEEITKEFMDSEPYSILLIELLEDPDKLGAFFDGVIPQSLLKAQKEAVKKYGSQEAAINALNKERLEKLEGKTTLITGELS